MNHLETLLGINLPAPTEFERGMLPVDVPGEEIWLNNRWQVNVREYHSFGLFAGQRVLHLSIKRLDKLPEHDWRNLQWIKNRIVGPDKEAIELYPMESRLVDGANQTHLWCLPDALIPVGWSERLVTEVSLKTKLPSGEIVESVQRPFAPHVRPADLEQMEEKQCEMIQRVNDRALALDAIGITKP